jgi:hypothetical protein
MTDDIVDLSIKLRGLPFCPIIDCGGNGVMVTLRPHTGPEVSSTAVSFALAWTGAINKMKAHQLVDYANEADYEATIADFQQGARLP